ncbi:uromodulin [Xenopus laevis]|uniref:ZP domain-containing protein n=2 Tax=Xenopus laevis TaxID=8355 RepID=A0A974DLZ9_XENLA|nr:uromodulin [Xenopus laevis]OCT94448.1 hypothetical protein XELAEV_18012119mg [Xenopus laevis]
MAMKLFLLLLLCSLFSASATCPPCAKDQVCNNITNSCDCNTSMYTESAIPPKLFIDCLGGDINIYIKKCQLEKNQYGTDNLHLNNISCLGSEEILNDVSYMAFLHLTKNGKCGNKLMVNSSHLTYSNTLFITAQSTSILERNDIAVNVSCSYPLNMNTTSNISFKPVLGTTQLLIPGSNDVMTVTMAIYKDSSFTDIITSDTLLLSEQYVYVSVLMPQLDTFSLKVFKLYASVNPDNTVGPIYNLLENGCPNLSLSDNTLNPIQNGIGTEARFKMKLMMFNAFSSYYLFAEVTICNKTCIQNCEFRSVDALIPQATATVSVHLETESHIDSADSGTFSCISRPGTRIPILLFLTMINFL